MTTGFYCVLIGPTAGPPAPRCWPRRASLVWACGRQNAPTGPSTRCQRLSVSRWPLRRSQKQKKETLGLWLSTCFVRTVGTTVTIHELMSLRMNLELMILLSFCITVAPLFCSGRHPYKVCPCDYSVCYFRVLFSWKCCRCNTSTGCTLLRFFSSSCFVIEFEEAGNIDCVSPSWLASTFLFVFFCNQSPSRWNSVREGRVIMKEKRFPDSIQPWEWIMMSTPDILAAKNRECVPPIVGPAISQYIDHIFERELG